MSLLLGPYVLGVYANTTAGAGAARACGCGALLLLLVVLLRHFVLEVSLPLVVWFVVVAVVLLLEQWNWWVPVPLLDPWLVLVLTALVAVAEVVAVLVVVDSLAVSLHAAVTRVSEKYIPFWNDSYFARPATSTFARNCGQFATEPTGSDIPNITG
jgi:hypothetical protein